MRRLLLLALLSLYACTLRGQDRAIGQHITSEPWIFWVVNESKESYKMAATNSDLLYFDTGQKATTLIVSLWESGYVMVCLQQTKGLFTTDPIGDSITCRFDDGPYHQYPIDRSKDGTKHFIGIFRAKDFYDNLVYTKKLMIRAIFDDGPKWMVFQVAGFNMNLLHIKNDQW